MEGTRGSSGEPHFTPWMRKWGSRSGKSMPGAEFQVVKYYGRKARSFSTWGSCAGSDITRVMCITVHRRAHVQSPGNRDGHPDRWTLPGDFTTRTVLVALARPP